MNPVLLLPAGLVALAALALPLLLHLARRDERTPVDFAALRWLSARARPRRSLRFEELFLLALRLLLVALLAVLLARPALQDPGTDQTWIVAVPGVGAEALRSATPPAGDGGSDMATGERGHHEPERRWLAPGFPTLDEVPTAHTAPVTSLLRELDMRMPAGAALTVLVPPVLDGIDAERPRLSRRVDWRVVDPTGPDPMVAAANGDPGDATGEPASRPPPRFVFPDAVAGAVADAVEDAGSAAGSSPAGDDPGRGISGARYLVAAAAAWQTVDDAPGQGLEVRAWPAGPALPEATLAWVESGGTVLLAHDAALPALDEAVALWSDARGLPLLRSARLGQGRVLQWTRPLDPGVFPELLEPDFPARLRDALQPPPPPSRVLAAEHAPLIADVGPWPAATRDLSPWLAMLVALLFALERWIAAGPRRERSA